MHDTSNTPDAIRASLDVLINSLAPGGELVYFVGHLAASRHVSRARRGADGAFVLDAAGNFVWDLEPVEPLNTVASAFEAAGADGRVFLFQQRDNGGEWRYIARRRVPPGNHSADGRRESASGRVS